MTADEKNLVAHAIGDLIAYLLAYDPNGAKTVAAFQVVHADLINTLLDNKQSAAKPRAIGFAPAIN